MDIKFTSIVFVLFALLVAKMSFKKVDENDNSRTIGSVKTKIEKNLN